MSTTAFTSLRRTSEKATGTICLRLYCESYNGTRREKLLTQRQASSNTRRAICKEPSPLRRCLPTDNISKQAMTQAAQVAKPERVPVAGFILMRNTGEEFQNYLNSCNFVRRIHGLHVILRNASIRAKFSYNVDGIFRQTSPFRKLWTSAMGKRSLASRLLSIPRDLFPPAKISRKQISQTQVETNPNAPVDYPQFIHMLEDPTNADAFPDLFGGSSLTEITQQSSAMTSTREDSSVPESHHSLLDRHLTGTPIEDVLADVARLSAMGSFQSSVADPSSSQHEPARLDPDAVAETTPKLVSEDSDKASEFRYWKRLTFNFSEEVILPAKQRVERMDLYGAVMTFDEGDDPDWCPPNSSNLLDRSPLGAPRRTFRSTMLDDLDYTLHDPKEKGAMPYIIMHPAVFGSKVLAILRSAYPKQFANGLVQDLPVFNCKNFMIDLIVVKLMYF